MIERPIEARLRAFYREEAPPGLAAPPELADAVDRIPDGEGSASVDRRRLTLLLVAAMLAVLVAGTAIALATGLLPAPWTPPARPIPALGLGGDCGQPAPGDPLITLTDGGSPGTARREVRVYADGRVVEIRPAYPSFEAEFRQLLLTGSGVEALLDRITEAGVATGCRSMFADAEGRSLTVSGTDGLASLWWGREYGGLRPLGAAELAALDRLAVDLGDPVSWLEASDLETASFERFVPDRWRIHVQVGESGVQPGDTLQTAEGVVFDGANPAFANLWLPGGLSPEEYGEPEGDEEAIRCGEVGADEAARVVDSLTAARASHVPNDVWEVFSEDLTASYVIQVMAMISDAEGCALAGMGPDVAEPTPSPAPDEDLAQVDPCDLVAAAVEDVATGELARWQASIPFDGSSSACGFPVGEGYTAVEITLRSRSTSLEEARWWVEALFGPRAVELPVEGGVAWENACLAEDLPCQRAVAMLVRERLLVVRLQASSEDDTSVDVRELARDIAARIASAPQ
jgi:hypothetical protein